MSNLTTARGTQSARCTSTRSAADNYRHYYSSQLGSAFFISFFRQSAYELLVKDTLEPVLGRLELHLMQQYLTLPLQLILSRYGGLLSFDTTSALTNDGLLCVAEDC
jgi:hypothetical protein